MNRHINLMKKIKNHTELSDKEYIETKDLSDKAFFEWIFKKIQYYYMMAFVL